ncbi:MAG: hypothetical protein Fur0010_16860 [Bdellovibrio sp.]
MVKHDPKLFQTMAPKQEAPPFDMAQLKKSCFQIFKQNLEISSAKEALNPTSSDRDFYLDLKSSSGKIRCVLTAQDASYLINRLMGQHQNLKEMATGRLAFTILKQIFPLIKNIYPEWETALNHAEFQSPLSLALDRIDKSFRRQYAIKFSFENSECFILYFFES